eukprot:gene33663-18611_t
MPTKMHTRLLNRSCAQVKDMDKDTVLSINNEFKSKHIKIKISPVVSKETEEEARETRSKSRKTMEHRNLIADCIAHLKDRFAPTPEDIKRRIESLIERDTTLWEGSTRQLILGGGGGLRRPAAAPPAGCSDAALHPRTARTDARMTDAQGRL